MNIPEMILLYIDCFIAAIFILTKTVMRSNMVTLP